MTKRVLDQVKSYSWNKLVCEVLRVMLLLYIYIYIYILISFQCLRVTYSLMTGVSAIKWSISLSFISVFTPHITSSALAPSLVTGCALHAEKGITAAWRSPNGGGNSKTGWELQNRAWLSPIDRQAHDTHAQFFLPINFSANSAPQLILKILSVVSITVLI